MKKNIVWLLIGLILLALGGYQNTQYEENSLLVSATITDIKTVEDTDDGPISYKHTYYGEYTVDGKHYSNKKLETKYTSSHLPDLSRGNTIEIHVNPDNPDKQVAEGGLFIMGGFALIIYNSIAIALRKKNKTKTAV